MKIRALLLLLVLPGLLVARKPEKKPISADDYARWNTIQNQVISATGKLVAYEVNPAKGDGKLVIFNHDDGKSQVIPRGKRPGIGPLDDFVVFSVSQPEDSIRKAKIKKVKKEEMPQDTLAILRRSAGITDKFPKLKSFSIPEENASWVAFTTTLPAKKDTTEKAKKQKPIKQPGDDLVLYDTRSGDTIQYHQVTEFSWPKKGGSLFIVRQRKDTVATYSTLLKFDTQLGKVTELHTAEGFIKKIASDEEGMNYSFLHSNDTVATKVYAVWLGKGTSPQPAKVAEEATPGMITGWAPSENGSLYFSGDATRLFMGTAPRPVHEAPDSTLEEDKPKVDVWNWKDLALQPQQKVEADREKKRTFLAVYHIPEGKFIQLADTNLTRVTTMRKGNGPIALGECDRAYQRDRSWTGNNLADIYIVDMATGEKRLLAARSERMSLSPGGKYVVWYHEADSSFRARSTQPGDTREVNLSAKIPFPIYNERNDVPDEPRPYGIAGWGEDDRWVFLYDSYDIWKSDLTGENDPVCATGGMGREKNIRFRYVRTDPEEQWIPAGSKALLSAFQTEAMTTGFYRGPLYGTEKPEALLMEKAWLTSPRKARLGDRLLWTRESFTDFPDLWSSNGWFGDQTRISTANPQQSEYIWHTVELVEWNSFTGEKLQGLLYKPENFDPAKKYPVIVYFYERNAEYLYRYSQPAPSRSTINRAHYCSNDYLVFIPDITYRDGYPGQSAYDAIVSGVYHLRQTRPWFDITRAGLQGQSWGGYQTVYLITRTNLFAAAMAGAPVSNMTSAYGGIRWESGMSRMFQYEHTQSRIGGTLWEKPMHYIENSPLFYAPNVTTPLLMMHNDNDGAVPWYQGIEFFTALRRLDKPVWMLTYNGEPHNLRGESWANRMDLDKRMFQFFNHYLKGEAAPPWMEKGIPAVDKGEDYGY